jgi:MFS family permease
MLLSAVFWHLSSADFHLNVKPSALPILKHRIVASASISRAESCSGSPCFLAYWFHVRYGADEAMLGSIFFGANLLAGASALLAVPLAKKIGLIRTMVFTHLPSNILLILVPLMPNFPLAITVLLLRFSISQMDVPTRQAFTMAVVAPDERSAAAGITGIARSVGASLSPVMAGALLALFPGSPFIIAGGLKIVYDLILYRNFKVSNVADEV